MSVAWLAGVLFTKVKFPALLGWVLTGVLLGPQLLDIVPYASDGTCNVYRSNTSLMRPDLHAALLLEKNQTLQNASDHAAHGHLRRALDTVVPRQLAGGAAAGGASVNMTLDQRINLASETWGANWGSHCMHLMWQGKGLHTNFWQFIGNVGVGLMIFESGMHIHFDKVRVSVLSRCVSVLCLSVSLCVSTQACTSTSTRGRP